MCTLHCDCVFGQGFEFLVLAAACVGLLVRFCASTGVLAHAQARAFGAGTHTSANACEGKVFSIEMHHTRHELANPGDNVGLNIKGLVKQNMPRVGDVMIYKTDKTLEQCGEFNAQIQTLDIPGEIKVGYSPIGFVRCGRSACRATEFVFKVGKETGGKKADAPHSLKSNEMAEVVFRPQQPLVVDSFKSCEGLSRIAFLDGNTAVMLGKVTKVKKKSEMPVEEKSKKKK